MEKEVYPYPSQHGSHPSMVVKEESSKLNNDKFVVCKDSFGLYLTETKNLDNNLSDPYRNASPEWRQNFLEAQFGEVITIV